MEALLELQGLIDPGANDDEPFCAIITHGELRRWHDEIERLQELLRGVGANRYWEGRWRDEKAEIERLRAALEKIVGVALGRSDGTFAAAMVHKIAMEALGHEQKAGD